VGEPRCGLTIIAFLGSVFSPYYAHARHRRLRRFGDVAVDALNHCSINVALYGAGQDRWTMTERGRDRVSRDATHLAIGPSAIEWDGDTLRLTLDEVAAPWPRRVRGTIEVACGPGAFQRASREPSPEASPREPHRVELDVDGRHRWGVIAPRARVDVALDAPHCAWSGSGYLDSNRGSVPLEHDFDDWSWSRAHLADGRTAVVYDVARREGPAFSLAQCFDAEGHVEAFDAPQSVALPRTRWGLDRTTRSTNRPTIAQSLEDGPFYARSVVEAEWLGERVTCVHEQLSLARFEQRWVRALLPFRMPRRGG
jgi:carotenoid 1,2-hydratase